MAPYNASPYLRIDSNCDCAIATVDNKRHLLDRDLKFALQEKFYLVACSNWRTMMLKSYIFFFSLAVPEEDEDRVQDMKCRLKSR